MNTVIDFRTLLKFEEYLNEDMGDRRKEVSHDLVGKELNLFLDDNGRSFYVRFINEAELEWWHENEEKQIENYDEVTVRDGIYFVDWQYKNDSYETMTLIIDFSIDEATLINCRLPKNEDHASLDMGHRIMKYNDLSAANVNVSHGGINRKRSTYNHGLTKELVGKRLIHYVSDTHQYEHIYLNEAMMVWHAHIGVDKGTADTARGTHLKIADNLYVLIFREILAPWVGVLVMDFDTKRSAGKVLYSLCTDYKKTFNYPCGTDLKLLPELSYKENNE